MEVMGKISVNNVLRGKFIDSISLIFYWENTNVEQKQHKIGNKLFFTLKNTIKASKNRENINLILWHNKFNWCSGG